MSVKFYTETHVMVVYGRKGGIFSPLTLFLLGVEHLKVFENWFQDYIYVPHAKLC